MIEQWTLSGKITLNMRNGEERYGTTAKLFVTTAGEPTLVQLRDGDTYTHLPWQDVQAMIKA